MGELRRILKSVTSPLADGLTEACLQAPVDRAVLPTSRWHDRALRHARSARGVCRCRPGDHPQRGPHRARGAAVGAVSPTSQSLCRPISWHAQPAGGTISERADGFGGVGGDLSWRLRGRRQIRLHGGRRGHCAGRPDAARLVSAPAEIARPRTCCTANCAAFLSAGARSRSNLATRWTTGSCSSYLERWWTMYHRSASR